MNFLKDVVEIFGGDAIARGFFIIEFALLVVYSLTSVVNHVLLNEDIRKTYENRAAFIEGLFRIYNDKKQKIEEEKREIEEARRERQEALGIG